jgi:hypothetical protein
VGWHILDPFPGCREYVRDNPPHELSVCISVDKPGGILSDYGRFVNTSELVCRNSVIMSSCGLDRNVLYATLL